MAQRNRCKPCGRVLIAVPGGALKESLGGGVPPRPSNPDPV